MDRSLIIKTGVMTKSKIPLFLKLNTHFENSEEDVEEETQSQNIVF